MAIKFHSDGRTQTVVIPGEWYIVNGERMKYLKTFNHRGIIRHFEDERKNLREFRPGDILTFKDCS